jgi:hypothetical protein
MTRENDIYGHQGFGCGSKFAIFRVITSFITPPPMLACIHLCTVFTPWTTRTASTCNEAQNVALIRWDDNGENSYQKTKQVGLGGGIEYALHPKFCRDMRVNLRGKSLSCEEIDVAVKHALAVWSARHPAIYFTKVDNTSNAELIIGAKSHTVVKWEREGYFGSDPGLKQASHEDELSGMAVDAEELSSPTILGFAQPLPASMQDSSSYRTGKVTGTNGD